MMGESSKTEPLFSKVLIYYFSGTGNAKSVAGWIKDVSERSGTSCSMRDLSSADPRTESAGDPDQLIGFCSPTHGFNYPPVTLQFILKFPRGGNRVFLVNTRAGMKLWKLHTPGLSGVALLLAALILICKGYRIVGMRPVDLPSNWISIHPGLRKKVIRSMFPRCERHVRKFARRLLQGGRDYRALLDIVQDLLVAPVALAYYYIGRFVLAKIFVANSACTRCRLCIRSCPVGAIREVGGRPFWTFRCESCMKCMNSCPERAIQTAHGLVIGLFVLLFNVVMEWLYFFSVERLPEGRLTDVLHNGWVEFLVASALCIPFIWLGYKLFHYLMRYRIFDFLVTWTSLTALKWWRRYLAPGGN